MSSQKASKALVIAARRYNGNELWTALGTLQSRGHSFAVASTHLEIVDEITGRRNLVQMVVDKISSDVGYSGLMFVSGNREDTEAYWHMPCVLSIVDTFYQAKKPIAAICISVPTIRKVAKGKRVSYFPLLNSRGLLLGAGALLQGVSITVDGNLVTAENQMCTQVWAEAFCDLLEGKIPDIHLVDSGFVPGKVERKPIPELEYLKTVVATTGRTKIK